MTTREGAMLGISLKMYFGMAQTVRWVTGLRALVETLPDRGAVSGMFVLPSFPMLESVGAVLLGSRIGWGAQDLAMSEDPAQTGEVSAGVLAEMGCRYAAVGHAERRMRFGETDAVVAAKAAQAFDHGLIPVLCVGEVRRTRPDLAAGACVDQLRRSLDRARGAELVVAYEPVWAIGAGEPAPPGHVGAVCSALREELAGRTERSHLLYGGSAGPSTFSRLGSSVDGLFLGRFAHELENVRAVLLEMAGAAPRRSDRAADPVAGGRNRTSRGLDDRL